MKRKRATSVLQPVDWYGWDAVLFKILSDAGGAMHWSQLCDKMIIEYNTACGPLVAGKECLRELALATIPEPYLSKEDELVRLPKIPLGGALRVLPYTEQRQMVIQTCLKMNALGINQGTAGNVSCRVPGGFVVTASGIAYDTMEPKHVIFLNLEGDYYGEYMPSSEWRMHCDIYKRIADAQAVVHAHPTHCTALACQRRGISAFHFMVSVAGGKEIRCAEYAPFGTQELSDNMLEAMGPCRSVLLANHGMICYGESLENALSLANDTECLARQYITALSIGLEPTVLPDAEMDMLVAKLKASGTLQSGQKRLRTFDTLRMISPRMRMLPSPSIDEMLSQHSKQLQQIIATCLKMDVIGLNQGISSNVSCRLPGGFAVTAAGVPFEQMQPKHLIFIDMEGRYYSEHFPSGEWRMHYDIYKRVPGAQAVIHAHPKYSTALACQRRGIPAFHYMVGVAGGREIKCAEYASFGSQELSDNMIAALGSRRSVLLANHGMTCHGPSLEKALYLAIETECLARQYIKALSTGSEPALISDEEMDVMLARLKTYGKQPNEPTTLTKFERMHAIKAPRFCGTVCPCY